MKNMPSQKVTVSLPTDILAYADAYKNAHNLNRSEVLALALRLLRQHELAEGYKALAAEQNSPNSDLIDSGIGDVLEYTEW